MIRKIDAASDHREEHKRKQEPEGQGEKQKIDDLLKAVKAADKQIQQLEYWSDIKATVQAGTSISAAAEKSGWSEAWQGVDKSGPLRTDSLPTVHEASDQYLCSGLSQEQSLETWPN